MLTVLRRIPSGCTSSSSHPWRAVAERKPFSFDLGSHGGLVNIVSLALTFISVTAVVVAVVVVLVIATALKHCLS